MKKILLIITWICFLMGICSCDKSTDARPRRIHEVIDKDSLEDYNPFDDNIEIQDFEESIKRISGDWISEDHALKLYFTNDKMSFKYDYHPNDLEYLSLLDGMSFKVNETLSFEINDIVYDIYWVPEEPDNMRLTAKSSSSNLINGITLRRNESE
ncbi:hypothetical protein JIN85_07405 [Luteolibacter pohnpeiensis]|uniref:Uncharacterized protein n=1 Tax=Luteolibacter pohnpeiensis TaxID=454153 RepID=A0A934S312_9BACT|nr:hypothetical protein [Luteolibacter pohnpeiensis]MBK1882235.1 hypothetical protein [Luteolibacter pohnpeiensis]